MQCIVMGMVREGRGLKVTTRWILCSKNPEKNNRKYFYQVQSVKFKRPGKSAVFQVAYTA